jgi:hypothetical protein
VGDATNVETWFGAVGRDSIKSGIRRTGALNFNIKEAIAQLEGNGDVLGAVLAMVEMENTTQTIEIGDGSVTAAFKCLAS